MVVEEKVPRTRIRPAAPLLPSDEEFARLQETDGSVIGYELEEAILLPMAPVYRVHSKVASDLYYTIRRYLEDHPIGEVWEGLATYLDAEGTRRYFPDVLFLATGDLHRLDAEKVVGPPTMVCEVSGDASRERDYGEKADAYHAAGVQWYWIADLVEQRITEYRRTETEWERTNDVSFGEAFIPQLFPGLTILIPRISG